MPRSNSLVQTRSVASLGLRSSLKALLLLLTVGLLIAGCGSGSGPGGNGDGGGDGDSDPPAAETPVELEGEPDDPVAEITTDVEVVVTYDDDAYTPVTTEGEEGRVLRREIEIGLSPEATLAEVEALLEGIDAAGIVSMVEGVPAIVVQIPDPGDLAALDALLDGLRAEPIVLYAVRSYEVEDPEPSGLVEPGGLSSLDVPDHVSTFGRLDHHLAARAHAAWNGRGALPPQSDRPTLVIGDSFGNGTPANGFDGDFVAGDFASGSAARHGHHVLGIILGSYDEDTSLTSARDDVTGLFPGTLDVRAVDLQSTSANTWPRRQNLLIRRIRAAIDGDPSARVVVNTSLNSRSLSNQFTQALGWFVRVRGGGTTNLSTLRARLETPGSGLESRFFHATSAGNANFDGAGNKTGNWPADENSLFAFAALNDITFQIPLFADISIPALINTVVVENRVNTGHATTDPGGGPDRRPLAGCASDGSIMGGTLSGMGSSVYSFNVGSAVNLSGTSMSTPQVAALAAWVWSLDPGLAPEEVLELLQDTALDDPTTTRTPGRTCNSVVPQPVIDAYAATFAAGGLDVMAEILDVTDDGRFDMDDLDDFEDELLNGSGDLDYGRLDLNGNGRAFAFAQGERLDLNGFGAIATTTRQITLDDGTTRLVTYDESDLSDLDVLCYFAYSVLYDGDTTARNAAWGDRCAGIPTLEIVSPAEGEILREPALSLTLEAEVGPPPNAVVSDFEVTWSYREGFSSPDATVVGTTLSGETLDVSDLPCASLWIRAEVDDPDGGVIAHEVNVACEPQQETFFLNAQRDQGGFVTDGGDPSDVWLGGDPKENGGAGGILVGDNFSEGIRAFLQFPLSTLPDDLASIDSATLSFTVYDVRNLPENGVFEFSVYQTDYGDDLSEDDFNAFPLPGRDALQVQDFTTGRKDLDLTVAVQDAWDDRSMRGERVQFIISMDPVILDNQEANQLAIAYEDRPGTYLLPALEITFSNY